MGLLDEPITRKELYLSYLNGNTNIKLPELITREELYLSYLCGNTSIKLPEPITRIEWYLYSLCINSSNVGGGDGGSNNPSEVEIVPFADATDAQIAAIAQALRAGTITPEETGWEVGDERTVQLSVIESGYMGNHVEQTQTLVILHKGGKLLENGKECSFVVGLKNCLTNGTVSETGTMNATATNSGGWNKSLMRAGCSMDFIRMIPEDLRPAFAKFQNIGTNTAETVSIDLFSILSETEVLGENADINVMHESEDFQFDYYVENSIKKSGDNGNNCSYWTRSRRAGNTGGFVTITSAGVAQLQSASNGAGISPYGCI